MSEPSVRRWRQIIRRLASRHVAVAGDLIADEFIYGRVERVSREAPVLILQYDSTEIVPGGGGNAANNAAALGARVDVIGVVGRDDTGRRLLAALPPNARTKHVFRASAYATPRKTRILAGGVHSAKQQVVRIDRVNRNRASVRPQWTAHVEQALAQALTSADAVIVSDYGTGLITPEAWRRARVAAGRRATAITLVDSRYALGSFEGMTACTPNESEVEALLGVRIGDDATALERAGREVLRRLRCQAVLITRGSRGMALFEERRKTDHIPIVGTDQIADVTGAGDTVIAAFALALAAGATYREAARLANHAGGRVVMKRGTATVSAAELLASVSAS
jgi:rfaE bifunctional protein kinase chain/domain